MFRVSQARLEDLPVKVTRYIKMSMIERIKEKARADRKTIVFPEGLEPRTVKACAILKAEGIADPVLLGKPEDILREAEELHADLTGIRIVDPEFDEKFPEYAETLYELRKMKGMTREKAAEVAKDGNEDRLVKLPHGLPE